MNDSVLFMILSSRFVTSWPLLLFFALCSLSSLWLTFLLRLLLRLLPLSLINNVRSPPLISLISRFNPLSVPVVCLKPIWLRPRQASPCCVSPLSQFAPVKSLPCFFIFVIFVRFCNSFPLPNPRSQSTLLLKRCSRWFKPSPPCHSSCSKKT